MVNKTTSFCGHWGRSFNIDMLPTLHFSISCSRPNSECQKIWKIYAILFPLCAIAKCCSLVSGSNLYPHSEFLVTRVNFKFVIWVLLFFWSCICCILWYWHRRQPYPWCITGIAVCNVCNICTGMWQMCTVWCNMDSEVSLFMITFFHILHNSLFVHHPFIWCYIFSSYWQHH